MTGMKNCFWKNFIVFICIISTLWLQGFSCYAASYNNAGAEAGETSIEYVFAAPVTSGGSDDNNVSDKNGTAELAYVDVVETESTIAGTDTTEIENVITQTNSSDMESVAEETDDIELRDAAVEIQEETDIKEDTDVNAKENADVNIKEDINAKEDTDISVKEDIDTNKNIDTLKTDDDITADASEGSSGTSNIKDYADETERAAIESETADTDDVDMERLSTASELDLEDEDIDSTDVSEEEIIVIEQSSINMYGVRPFDFIMDPQRLITATNGAKYGNISFEEGSTLFFRNSEGRYDYSSRSDQMTITSRSTVPVVITLSASLWNSDSISLTDDPTFKGDNRDSLYLALVDNKGHVVPLSENGEVQIIYEMEEISKEEAIEGAEAEQYSFGLVGACNSRGSWAGFDELPQIVVTWEVAPIVDNQDVVSDNSISDNSVSMNTVSDNSISMNSVSMNTVSDNSISMNSVSMNTVSDNSISMNSVSMNTVSDNSISMNSVSMNTVSDNCASMNGVSDNNAEVQSPEAQDAEIDSVNNITEIGSDIQESADQVSYNMISENNVSDNAVWDNNGNETVTMPEEDSSMSINDADTDIETEFVQIEDNGNVEIVSAEITQAEDSGNAEDAGAEIMQTEDDIHAEAVCAESEFTQTEDSSNAEAAETEKISAEGSVLIDIDDTDIEEDAETELAPTIDGSNDSDAAKTISITADNNASSGDNAGTADSNMTTQTSISTEAVSELVDSSAASVQTGITNVNVEVAPGTCW